MGLLHCHYLVNLQHNTKMCHRRALLSNICYHATHSNKSNMQITCMMCKLMLACKDAASVQVTNDDLANNVASCKTMVASSMHQEHVREHKDK